MVKEILFKLTPKHVVKTMNRRLIAIIIIITLLVLGLIFGSPIEFLNPIINRVATIILELTILLSMMQLFRLIRYIDKKPIKWVTGGLVCIIAIPYITDGIMTTILVTSSRYPMWEDIAVYTKADGEKVISQMRETSGSIYDYRSRKIFAQYEQIRISLEVNVDKMTGLWTEQLMGKDSVFTINLDKTKIDYCKH